MASSDEYGDVDDDDILQAALDGGLQEIVSKDDAAFAASPRPAKRPRLSLVDSGDESDSFEPCPAATRDRGASSHTAYPQAKRPRVSDEHINGNSIPAGVPQPHPTGNEVIYVSSQAPSYEGPVHKTFSTASIGNRQTTLSGNILPTNHRNPPLRNYPAVNRDEPPTHHELDEEAMKTWTYPTNLGRIRDYQYNIVQLGLFNNLLVALPTGLGKTFIAATIMLNWYRWTKKAQIIFVAPTKPLVAQQVEACFQIAGIPRSDTTMMTGNVSAALRSQEWIDKRVFFMTPQTVINDLKNGIADPDRIVLIVVDEAHRAKGGYAYSEIIKFVQKTNQSFRILALTATPGSTVESVQDVLDDLLISKIEIRNEFSIDIREYVHGKDIDIELFEPSEEMNTMKALFAQALQPLLDKLVAQNACWTKDPMVLSTFMLLECRKKWIQSPAGRQANPGLQNMLLAIFTILSSLAHSITLLNFHGIGPFYHALRLFEKEVQEAGNKGSKYKRQVCDHPQFKKLMLKANSWTNDPGFLGHPKLVYLQEVVLNHLMNNGEGQESTSQTQSRTRVMVFVKFRDSADEVIKVLKRHEPIVRPSLFIGQAASRKGTQGMSQKYQQEVVARFQRGEINTLVATSIGEEGLDIGEVDLIVCYDASASPIRTLQRMGRTGRKRVGNVALLLMRGKEEDAFSQAKDNYEKMQQMIESKTRFKLHTDKNRRILPRTLKPEVNKCQVEIPVENAQSMMPEPRRNGKAPKKPPKKFRVPEGAVLGFQKASRVAGGLRNGEISSGDDNGNAAGVRYQKPTESLAKRPKLAEVTLSAADERLLDRLYRDTGGSQSQTVPTVCVNAFPERQRELGGTGVIAHGSRCKRITRMLSDMHGMTEAKTDHFNNCLNPKDVHDSSDDLDGEEESEATQATHKQRAKKKVTRPKKTQKPQIWKRQLKLGEAEADLRDNSDYTDTDDEEMRDFIVDDEDEILGVPSIPVKKKKSTTSANQKKPAKTSRPSTKQPAKAMISMSDSDSDVSLPRMSEILAGHEKSTPQTPERGRDDRQSTMPSATQQRKGRRNVLDDSDG